MPFRTACCRALELPEEKFEVAVVRRCFPWWSRALGNLWVTLNPGSFRREFRLLAQLGRATHPSQFQAEFEAYQYELVRDKVHFRARTLGLRVSRRRFERLAMSVRTATGWSKSNASAADPAHGTQADASPRAKADANVRSD